MTIRMLKLVTGEEIVCLIEQENCEALTIKDPVIMMVAGAQVMAARWLYPLVTQTEFVIRRDHIVAIVTPQEKIVDVYNEQFGNGLTMVKRPGLVLPQ